MNTINVLLKIMSQTSALQRSHDKQHINHEQQDYHVVAVNFFILHFFPKPQFEIGSFSLLFVADSRITQIKLKKSQ